MNIDNFGYSDGLKYKSLRAEEKRAYTMFRKARKAYDGAYSESQRVRAGVMLDSATIRMVRSRQHLTEWLEEHGLEREKEK